MHRQGVNEWKRCRLLGAGADIIIADFREHERIAAYLWGDWKETLLLVKPETVLRWHRKRFASYWTRLSRQAPGRPRTDREMRELTRRIAHANIL